MLVWLSRGSSSRSSTPYPGEYRTKVAARKPPATVSAINESSWRKRVANHLVIWKAFMTARHLRLDSIPAHSRQTVQFLKVLVVLFLGQIHSLVGFRQELINGGAVLWV